VVDPTHLTVAKKYMMLEFEMRIKTKITAKSKDAFKGNFLF